MPTEGPGLLVTGKLLNACLVIIAHLNVSLPCVKIVLDSILVCSFLQCTDLLLYCCGINTHAIGSNDSPLDCNFDQIFLAHYIHL